ncbi:MAG: hypothetical protein QOD41_1115, partial [Cryptosporangiaceae bacterium]|nr:hypothetical protein [Cryptosporangiaceae bacterium]
MDERPFDAVLFDMDGVVTDTAAVHAAAWEALFAEYAGTAGEPFDTTGDYRRYVDGRSREDGVRGFLASRFLRIPDGEPTDAAGIATVHGLAARKQQLFADRLRTHGTRAFPSTVALLRRLRAAGIPTALVTASRNSAEVLAAAGLVEAFDAQVNGDDAIRLGLAGKPDPAMFLEAARRLGVPPGRAVVIEDAEAGVRAGAAGQFGLVVGVDRTSHRSALLAAGANVVVTDLSSLDLLHPIDPGRPDWCAGADSSGGPWL